MRIDSLQLLLWILVFIGGIYLTIRYLWPLVLLILAVIGYGMFRMYLLNKRVREQAEKADEELFSRENSYQDDLFYEQAARKREESGEVVDVEFTRKEEPEKEEKRI